jgi:TfoX/Sxy family transcriptional regulator of competence genes
MGQAAFDAVAATLLPDPDVEEGTGFGTNPGLRVRGKIFAILHDGELVLKLPAGRCTELVEAGRARPFEVGRRKMREWVSLAEVDEQEWLSLAREAREYVAS